MLGIGKMFAKRKADAAESRAFREELESQARTARREVYSKEYVAEAKKLAIVTARKEAMKKYTPRPSLVGQIMGGLTAPPARAHKRKGGRGIAENLAGFAMGEPRVSRRKGKRDITKFL